MGDCKNRTGDTCTGRSSSLGLAAIMLPVMATLSMALPSPVAAQVVTTPQLDGAVIRARLAPTWAQPGRTFPKDAADLDAMLAQKDVGRLTARLRAANKADEVLLDLNWEQTQLFNGAGFIIAYAYMVDLWRLGSVLPGPNGDQMKQTAAMLFLYSVDLVTLDGPRCADPSAPGHRQDQLFMQNKALIDYIRSLPRATRMTLGTVSLDVELATAAVRSNDDVLCSGGLAQITQGLKAQGDKPLPQVPNAPGTFGKTYIVPLAPGYKPEFNNTNVWQPKQMAARQKLPENLTRLLTLPTDEQTAPTSK